MDQRMAGQLQPETVFQDTAPAFTHSCPSTTAAPVWRAMGTTKPMITNWPRAQTGRLDSPSKAWGRPALQVRDRVCEEQKVKQ